MNEAPEVLIRKTGSVTRIRGDYGFVSTEDFPQGIYFKTAWFQGSPPLQEGELITFQLKDYLGKPQAHDIRRSNEPEPLTVVPSSQPLIKPYNRRPSSERFLDWAYLGRVTDALTELKILASDERWEFRNAPQSTERPFPILFSYLMYTYGRLVRQNKVMVNEEASIAAFNTGLVDRRYEPIYAVFMPNNDPRQPWKLSSFCVAGENKDGQNLVRYFNPLPTQAHYFDDPSELLYDIRAGKPEMNWNHVVIDNIDRFPREFLEDHCPPGFTLQEQSAMTEEERIKYFEELRVAIESHDRRYRTIMNRLKDALDLSIKRVSWNFKTAIPQYYPRMNRLTLLLPISLVSDEHVDLALAVEKTPSGKYLGHTILPLDWAYKNARLICRPDSDWLIPQEIIEEDVEEAEV